MAFSHVSYVATPGQDTFALTFEYLKRSHVHVYIDEVETVAFSILGTDVVLDTPAAGGEVVRLQRLTPNTVAGFLTDYQDGQTPRASDHDTNRVQLLYIIQEALDGVTEVEGLIGTGAALPPAEGVSDFIVSDGAGDAWDVKSLAQTKTILGIGGAEVLPPAEGVGDFLVSDAAGEDGWDVKSTAQAKTVLGIEATLPLATGALDFLVAAGAGDDWDTADQPTTKALLDIDQTLDQPTAQYDFLVADAAGDGGWDVKTLAETKTILGLDGIGPGMLEFRWVGTTNEGTTVNADIDDGFMRSMPGVSTTVHRVRMSGVVPVDFDVQEAFTLHVLVHVNGAPADGDFNIDFFRAMAGVVQNGVEATQDLRAVLSVTAAGTVQHELAYFTIPVTPGSALAGANALWLRIGKAASFTGDFYFPHVWITY